MTHAGAPTQPAATLAIRLFGACDVRREDGALLRTRSRKELWLLALLALRPRQALDREWLAGTLWPDIREAAALGNLRRSLTDLRKVLGPDASRLSCPTPRTLTLDLDGVAVDVLEFDAALSSNDSTALERAIALRRGPLLEGCAEEWVLAERQNRELGYLAALERLGREAITRGEPDRAERCLRAAIALDPLRETAQRALLEALAASGAFAAASQAYRDLRLLLHRELNAAPAPETTALFEQIRARGRALAAPALAKPGASPAPQRLPAPLTPLIGREGEVAEVCARLASSRLVTLVGSGGVGKTRLAIQVCEALADRFPDGLWFADLAPLTDGSLIASTVAGVIEARESTGCTAADAVVSALRNRTSLLVLDNCEHLLDDGARFASSLLQACQGLRILATSRGPLRVAGETSWRVPPLSLPPADALAAVATAPPDKDLAAGLLEYDAVRLFVERGIQANAAWRPAAVDLVTVAEVCRRLDGIPLALELAAARVRVLPLRQISARLDDRFRLLTGGGQDVLPRHQTLRALLDWSYDLLSEPERALLMRLSVFAGGWDLEAAEKICSNDEGPPTTDHGAAVPATVCLPSCIVRRAEVLDLLARLVDNSLVTFLEHEGQERYSLLESVRQYARDRLTECDKEEAARRQHLDYFLRLAEEAEPELRGREQPTWLSRLEVEHENLRSALDWACGEGADGQAALRLGAALWKFWNGHGHLREGRWRLETTLAAPGGAGPTEARARALNGLAAQVLYLGDTERALSIMQEVLALWRALGNRRWTAVALTNLGIVHSHQGDLSTARHMQEESLAISRTLADRRELANAISNLGYVAWLQGDYAAARLSAEESLALGRELGDTRAEAVGLDNLGGSLWELGEMEEGRSCLVESLQIFQALDDPRLIAQSLESFARLAAAERDACRAVMLLGAAAEIRRAIDSPLPPNEAGRQERLLADARAALGKAAIAGAWSEGGSMTLAQVIAYALGEAVAG